MRRINKKSKFKTKLLLIAISIILITSISIFIIINNNKNKDIFKNQNILLGSWIYNEYGGTYVFTNDFNYIQYSNSDISDNYCKGKYQYTYGVTQNDITIRQDKNYFYYTLKLKEEYCLIMKKEFYDEYTKNMYIGINKDNSNNITMINKDNPNNIIYLKKQTQ